ncbi:MAG: hypothetical protein J5592_05975, partial [Clostridia bacterium]|nr:hypothetical protein [Clostridia bacterium]
MLFVKKHIADRISAAAPALFGGTGLGADSLLELLEYPPDSSMGDIALPCFKLARTLRQSPV